MKHTVKTRAFCILIFTALVIFVSNSPPYAATPQKINYQGYIKDNGIPVDVATNFVFEICDAADCSGVVFCTETAPGVTVSKGRFSWLIGTDGACDLTSVPWGLMTLYLRITVNGQVMTPSEEITSSSYSLSNDYGTPLTTFTIDRDNSGAGVSTDLAFNRGTDNANDALLSWDEANDEFILTSDGAALATVTFAIASATTYYGDGSHLTGIGGGDPTKVAKAGDTMSGPLNINYNTATSTLHVTNAGTGYAITATGTVTAYGNLNIGAPSGTPDYDVNFYGTYGGMTDGRMFWDASKDAFRAGREGTVGYWGDANVGQFSFGAGVNIIANGGSSVAMGAGTIASGMYSTSLGFETTASGKYSLAAGRWVTAGAASDTVVIGRGVDNVNRIVNNIENSLIVGFNSNKPTLFVGPATGFGTYGRVGVATTTTDFTLSVDGDIGATNGIDIRGPFEINNIAGAPGQVLTSNGAGVAPSWQAAGVVGPYVAKTGDTMTGPLLVNANSATASFAVTNMGGGGYSAKFTNNIATATVYAENTAAGGQALYGNATAGGVGVYGKGSDGVYGTTGAGGAAIHGVSTGNTAFAGYFENRTAPPYSTVYAYSNGATATIYAVNTEGTNSSSGVYAEAAGNGYGIYGRTTGSGSAVYGYNSSAGAAYGVYGRQDGTGAAVNGMHAGGGAGYGVYGSSSGGAGVGVLGMNGNTGVGVKGWNSAGGRAGYFYTNAVGNATDVVYITTNSTTAGGRGLYVKHTGTGGSAAVFDVSAGGSSKALISGNMAGTGALIDFSTNSNRVFYVDNDGNVFASGTIQASSCPAGMNDGTGALSFCISDAQQGPTGFIAAAVGCNSQGGMLCSLAEWHVACNLDKVPNNPFDTDFWIDADFGDGNAMTLASSDTSCSAGVITMLDYTLATSKKYLCCADK